MSAFDVSVSPRNGKKHLRKAQLSDDARLVEGQPCCANSVKAPDTEEQPEPIIFESVLELLPIEIFLRRPRRIDGKATLDECLFILREPLYSRWN